MPGHRCSVGGVCLPGDSFPPIAHLGFEITERDEAGTRIEVAGCDPAVRSNDPGTIVISKDSYTGVLALTAEQDLGREEPERRLLSAMFELRQSSRFSLGRIVPSDVPRSHPASEENPAVLFDWARYHPHDKLGFDPSFLIWRIIPATTSPAEAPPPQPLVYRPLRIDDIGEACVSDDECCSEPPCVEGICDSRLNRCRPPQTPSFPIEALYYRACERPLEAQVVRVASDVSDPAQSDRVPVESGEIELFNFQPPGERAMLPIEQPFRCRKDSDCPSSDQICDSEAKLCAFALGGRAASAKPASLGIDGEFTSVVYLYPELGGCTREGVKQPLQRTYAATVRPDSSQRVLPTMSFEIPVVFDPSLASEPPFPPGTVERDICLVDLGAPHELEVELSGEPVQLLGGAATYTCCDLSCLPLNETMQMPPNSPPATCTGQVAGGGGAVQITADSPVEVTPQLETLWEDELAPCLPPIRNGSTIGMLDSQASCEAAGLCRVPELAVPTAGERSYRLKIVTPSGALHQSQIVDVELGQSDLDASGVAQLDVQLQPRHLVRGFVTLPPELCGGADDCGSENAAVLAERLRMPGETTDNTPSPYFHEISTFYDPVSGRHGAYILPLDPGVWVLTALPAPGAGGPARFEVVDLRSRTNVEIDFELELGILVTLELEQFARNTEVVPIDRGSWRQGEKLLHPARANAEDEEDRLLDLNAVEECFAAPGEPVQGCKIRRLTRNSKLPLSQVGTVRFSARSSVGGTDCTDL